MSRAKILIDVTKLKHPNNGLDTFLRAYVEQLESLASDYPFDISLLLPKKPVANFETHFPCISQGLFKGMQLKKLSHEFDLWHSTFHTLNKPQPGTCQQVSTVHDLNPIHEKPHKKDAYLKLSAHHLKDATHLVSISQFTQSEVETHHPQLGDIAKSVIYNGVDTAVATTAPATPPQGRFLFSLGAFMRKKNYESIVHMMPHVQQDVSLVIAGSSSGSYIEELAQLAAELGVSDRVQLMPNISLADRNWYLNHCAAFLFPSKLEGFGLPPAEAMKCGKTPFIFEATSVPEVVGKAGHYWSNEEPTAMAAPVNAFLEQQLDTDEATRALNLSQAEKFSWEKMTRAYLDLFAELLKK